MKKTLITTLLLSLFTISACAPQLTATPLPVMTEAPQIPVTEVPAEKSYTNSGFGFGFQFPSSWFGPEEYISDPILRVECDPSTVSAVALFPFGLRLPLVRRPGSYVFEGRILVPEGQKDGGYTVRIVLRDAAGGIVSETKRFVIDGRAPTVIPEIPPVARPGELLRVAVRTDEDVIVLEARLGEGAPVPLRWDGASQRSVGLLRVPAALIGVQSLFIEAVDAAKNRGFARARIEVRP